jgi:hypothetical protein
MIGAGTVINPILKIVTTVAILAAVSIFVVKPIIESGEKASDASREQSDRISRQVEESTRRTQLGVARGIALDAARAARIAGDRGRAQRIIACVKAAGDDPVEMDFCRGL